MYDRIDSSCIEMSAQWERKHTCAVNFDSALRQSPATDTPTAACARPSPDRYIKAERRVAKPHVTDLDVV